MKVIIEDLLDGEEECVIFKTRALSENMLKALQLLKSPGDLTVYLEDQVVLLDIGSVYYVESIDLKTFVYGKQQLYRSRLKLYEIEELLAYSDFLRISKQTLVNVKKIKGISPAGGGRFQALLKNEEKVLISRQYVPQLKERFGL